MARRSAPQAWTIANVRYRSAIPFDSRRWGRDSGGARRRGRGCRAVDASGCVETVRMAVAVHDAPPGRRPRTTSIGGYERKCCTRRDVSPDIPRIQQGSEHRLLRALRIRGHRRNRDSGRWSDTVGDVEGSPLSRAGRAPNDRFTAVAAVRLVTGRRGRGRGRAQVVSGNATTPSSHGHAGCRPCAQWRPDHVTPRVRRGFR